jgi:hypothetical protein
VFNLAFRRHRLTQGYDIGLTVQFADPCQGVRTVRDLSKFIQKRKCFRMDRFMDATTDLSVEHPRQRHILIGRQVNYSRATNHAEHVRFDWTIAFSLLDLVKRPLTLSRVSTSDTHDTVSGRHVQAGLTDARHMVRHFSNYSNEPFQEIKAGLHVYCITHSRRSMWLS